MVCLRSNWSIVVVLRLSGEIGWLLLNGVVLALIRCRCGDGLRRKKCIGRIERHREGQQSTQVESFAKW